MVFAILHAIMYTIAYGICIYFSTVAAFCCYMLWYTCTLTLFSPHRELEDRYHAGDSDAQNFFKSYKLYLDQLFSTHCRLSIRR